MLHITIKKHEHNIQKIYIHPNKKHHVKKPNQEALRLEGWWKWAGFLWLPGRSTFLLVEASPMSHAFTRSSQSFCKRKTVKKLKQYWDSRILMCGSLFQTPGLKKIRKFSRVVSTKLSGIPTSYLKISFSRLSSVQNQNLKAPPWCHFWEDAFWLPFFLTHRQVSSLNLGSEKTRWWSFMA